MAKKTTKSHCLVFIRYIGQLIVIDMLFRKQCLSCCNLFFGFGILCMLLHKHWWKFLSAIRYSQNPPKCKVAIHGTIVQNCTSNHQCLPALTKNTLPIIVESSILLKLPTKCTSPPQSSALPTLSQTTRAQSGVNSPLVLQ